MSASPTQWLDRLGPQSVTLHLKDGRRLAGRLAGADEHLNVVLDDAKEMTDDLTRRLGRIVVRGSNVLTLTAAGEPAAAARV